MEIKVKRCLLFQSECLEEVKGWDGLTSEQRWKFWEGHDFSVKFAVIGHEGEFTVVLGPRNVEHVRLAELALERVSAAVFIGAGDLGPSKDNSVYRSDTCKKAFRYDRPEDPLLAEELLMGIRSPFSLEEEESVRAVA
jgi:hypothetical protein